MEIGVHRANQANMVNVGANSVYVCVCVCVCVCTLYRYVHVCKIFLKADYYRCSRWYLLR